jgi:hypothetical protein
MMRIFVGLLLLANIVFYVWSQGWIDDLVGVHARGDREPDRLNKQVRPETVRILTPQAVAAAASAAESSLVCLEAGPFDEAAIPAAESIVRTSLPQGSWARLTQQVPARWIVYMGRYPNRDAQQKKEQELTRLKVPYEEVASASGLEPGLSLGLFPNREQADAALQRLADRGIRTGRVVELSKAGVLYMLRVERADADMSTKVSALRGEVLGRGFAACSPVRVQSAER